MTEKKRDPATYSNYEQVSITNYDINWTVDFDNKRLVGSVTIHFIILEDCDTIILDGRDLEIEEITDLDGKTLTFTCESEEILGTKISVSIGSFKKGKNSNICVKYKTAPNARALQFLTSDQTSDNLGPYVFSQCQPIHARSILPCFDSPSSKSTYNAQVTTPALMTCLMSAIGDEPICNGDTKTWYYKQTVAIPSYLIAIVVGRLESQDISNRCRVWGEPSVVHRARQEFERTEEMLKVAEDLAGPYVWGRYDMVVLPSTFPFGGMENPCLTFVTPTLLAGDRSMVNVIAHEIAHSWTGNLVTNANWEHFWLNEGFTVFLERKIHGRMHNEQERQFESECGFDDHLVPTVTKVFHSEHEFTKLIQNHNGIDPDDAFSSVPYEKGSALLFTIEQKLGDTQRFEQFLKDYISKYSYKTVITDDWKTELYDYFADRKDLLDQIDWNLWLYQPGLPPRPSYDSTLMNDCRTLANRWLSEQIPQDYRDYEKMSSTQKVAVLSCIRNNGSFTQAKMPLITSIYRLDQATNCEIKFNWLMLGLETKWADIVTPAISFVVTVGRLKYCKPIYKALFEWPYSSTRAITSFKQCMQKMHPITANIIGKLVPK